MPAKNEDLHGNAPDKSAVVLLIIDMINDLAFDSGPALLEQALPAAERLAALKKRARRANVPVIYVNDNFGKWRSDQARLVAHVLEQDVRGRPLAELLKPEPDDYFVMKPKHSGFYSTTLDTLLHYLEAETLILTGLTTNSCVLFTANDAFMRDYHILVPEDCVAAADPEESRYALRQMETLLDADTRPSDALDLDELKQKSPAGAGA
jgi:nicotinamidase-related amidase